MDKISKHILDTIQIGALATVNPDETPLITPLHFARMDDHIIWITGADSQHSENYDEITPVKFVVWDEQKQAVYLKTIVLELEADEIKAAEAAYQEELGDFRPQVDNPTFYKAPIGKLDKDFPDGVWKHYIS